MDATFGQYTIDYDRRGCRRMALLCGIGLPLLSPTMLATGPAAIVLIPLLLIGGPYCAFMCLWRAYVTKTAFHYGYDELIATSVWWRTRALPRDLVNISYLVDVTTYWFLPIAKKPVILVELRGGLFGTRKKKLELKLLDCEVDEIEAMVEDLRSKAGTQDLALARLS